MLVHLLPGIGTQYNGNMLTFRVSQYPCTVAEESSNQALRPRFHLLLVDVHMLWVLNYGAQMMQPPTDIYRHKRNNNIFVFGTRAPGQSFFDTSHQKWSEWKTNRSAVIAGRFKRKQLTLFSFFSNRGKGVSKTKWSRKNWKKNLFFESSCDHSAPISFPFSPFSMWGVEKRLSGRPRAAQEIRPSRSISKSWNQHFKAVVKKLPRAFYFVFCWSFEIKKSVFCSFWAEAMLFITHIFYR